MIYAIIGVIVALVISFFCGDYLPQVTPQDRVPAKSYSQQISRGGYLLLIVLLWPLALLVAASVYLQKKPFLTK